MPGKNRTGQNEMNMKAGNGHGSCPESQSSKCGNKNFMRRYRGGGGNRQRGIHEGFLKDDLKSNDEQSTDSVKDSNS